MISHNPPLIPGSRHGVERIWGFATNRFAQERAGRVWLALCHWVGGGEVSETGAAQAEMGWPSRVAADELGGHLAGGGDGVWGREEEDKVSL